MTWWLFVLSCVVAFLGGFLTGVQYALDKINRRRDTHNGPYRGETK